MPAKWHKYSYSAQRAERQTIFSIVFIVISLSIVFALIHSYLITMYSIESSTMSPAIVAGDLLISTPLYYHEPRIHSQFSFLISPKRGDLVVIAPEYPNDFNFLLRATNSLIAFLTFQKIRPFEHKNNWGEKPVIRRLVAFPGDSVYIEDFILHIKTNKSEHYLTEFEISDRSYDLQLDSLPAGWSSELPLSGSFPEITLGKNEVFVLCDNRISATDSRMWGPISSNRIQGKVLLRYWPFSHFGTP